MLKNFQKSLLISTAIPVAFMAASAAQARDVSVPAPVAPATSVPGTTVNAAIVTAITAPDDANLKLTVPSAGVVLGDSIVLNPNTGQGDGKIEFLSDGKIGAVDAATGSVTDGAGAIFNGRAAAGAANSFKGTNNGLIAGGLRTVGFGGDASITNGGEIYNGITASGQGNVSITTSAAGAVRSGNVVASSITVDTAAAPVDGVTKTSFAGGKASIVQAGDAADAEDSVRGNLNATGLNGAEVTVSAKARNVIASAGGVTETVGGSNAVTSGTVTTTTVRNDVTRGGGSANVTVGGDGDVALVSATGIGGASATIDGAVAGNVNASSNGTSTTYTDISVVDGAVPVSGSTKTTSTAVGKAADVSVGEDGSVGGSVSVNGQGSASTVIDGTVDGNVSLTSTATNNAYDYASTPTGYTYSDTNPDYSPALV